MYKVVDKNIYLNRGDAITIVLANNSDTFQLNDTIKIYICEQGDYSNVIFSKTFTVEEESNEVSLSLTSAETRIGEPIKSGSKVYWYEIELNNHTTLVGYDNNGPKLFTLWPEAVESGD